MLRVLGERLLREFPQRIARATSLVPFLRCVIVPDSVRIAMHSTSIHRLIYCRLARFAPFAPQKRNKCGLCKECLRDDCGECTFCLDKSKFGGPNILKQVCRHKRCMWKRYAPTAAVTPEMKKELMERHERADEEGVAPAEEEFLDGRKLGEMFDPASAAEDATACPGNDDNETLGDSDEAPAAAAAAASSGGDGTDVVSVAGTQDIHNAVAEAGESGVGGDGVVDGNTHTPNDLARCQMELQRTRSEIARQADEIRRLKSAVRALTAVLTE